MADKTFKQQVEEIQCDLCNWKEDGCEYKPDVCPVVRVTTDRILSAHNAELDRMIEQMPDKVYYGKVDDVLAYIQAQKEGM